jgi:hypothetical protein
MYGLWKRLLQLWQFQFTLCNTITFAWQEENWKLCGCVTRNLISYLSLNPLQSPVAILFGTVPLCKVCEIWLDTFRNQVSYETVFLYCRNLNSKFSLPETKKEKLNSMVWVRERTIPTERPPLPETRSIFRAMSDKLNLYHKLFRRLLRNCIGWCY